MKIKFTGTGDGRGIPAIGCRCERCTYARSHDGKDRRRRVSVLIRNQTETILFDTPPTIGEMINEEPVFKISAVFLSHKHFDHIGGITEFEYWPERIPVYGNMSVLGNFEITDKLYERCKFHVLHEGEPVRINAIRVTPFSVSHKIPTFGLVFKEGQKQLAHFSDKLGVALSEEEKRIVNQADVAVFHTPGFEGGTDHIDVVSVMQIAKKYPSTRFVITHIGHNNLSHEDLEKAIRPYENMVVAYDGLELAI